MRALTPLMLPTSLQPPLTGPRSALPVTIHRIADDADEETAAPTTQLKGHTMTHAQKILAALKRRSPLKLDELEAATGISRAVLGVTLPAMVKKKELVRSPNERGVYGMPGTPFTTTNAKTSTAHKAKTAKKTRSPKASKPAASESFAAGVKAREAEMEQQRRSNGTDLDLIQPNRLPDRYEGRNAREVRDFNLFTSPLDVTSIPARAIATAAGGAIVLRGNTLTAELDAEEVNVIHQLRG